MSLQSVARSALAAIRSAVPDSVVTVIYGSHTAQGVRDTITGRAEADGYGEKGPTSSTVRVSMEDLVEIPANGETIRVDGEDVIVLQTRLDPAGALCAIEYQDTHPVEGV